MRITFVMGGGFVNLSGGDRVISIYARKLHERGHRVDVVARRAYMSRGDRVRSLLRADWLRPKRQLPSHFAGAPYPHRCLKTYRPVRNSDLEDADVVIATWWETAEWVLRLSPEKGAKAYFLQHFEAFDYLPKERVEATWRMPLQKIVISSWLDGIARDFGDDGACMVPNSVDLTQFTAPRRTKNALPTVGMIYNPTPWKGFGDGMAAIRALRERLPELQLVTFGITAISDEPLPSWHTHHVSLPQDRLREAYASCDVWLCSSHSEGFCLPMLEAMACRTPVVATRVGGPVDVITDGENGFLVPIGDVAAMTDRLAHVLQLSPDRWLALSDAAFAKAVSYTWDDATDRFEHALEVAIERNARAGGARGRT